MKINNVNLKYYYWVFEALQKDNFKCINCKNDNFNDLIVHHKDGSRKNGQLNMNNNLNNLETLCFKCHAKRHGLVKKHPEIIEMVRMGLSFSEIGRRLGISRQRVHQINKHG